MLFYSYFKTLVGKEVKRDLNHEGRTSNTSKRTFNDAGVAG
jgi:hypothetical protein